jgi:7-cyano-7-deazaguanine synthase
MGASDNTPVSGQKVIVLLSGGVDSVTAFYSALKEYNVVCALSFHYGAKHNAKELECARYHASLKGIRHEIISLDFMDRLFNPIFCNRALRFQGLLHSGEYEKHRSAFS